MKFQFIEDKIFAARPSKMNIDLSCGTTITKAAFRLDGRSGSWRVEWKHAPLTPWVPIDDGEGFLDFEEAQKYAELFLSACRVQGTIYPKLSRKKG